MIGWTRLTRSARAAMLATALAVLAPASGHAAAIKGTVQYVGPPVEGKKVSVTVDQFVCGKDKDAEDLVVSAQRGIRNAVVSLASPPAGARSEFSMAPVFLDQRQCVFAPRVILVPAGGTVEFLNSDRLLHNIHSTGKENPVFNRTQPRARTIPIAFPKPEVVRIGCDLHGWMRAWIVVMEHPFYAVTGGDGEFTLPNVSPGRYTLNVWHETLGVVTRDVNVGDGEATVTIEMRRR